MGVDAHQLVAGEGTHLHLLTVQGVGGQLGGGVVLAPGILSGAGVPSAGDGGAAAAVLNAGNDVGISAGLKGGLLADIQNGLRYISAGGFVPVADGVDAVIREGGFQTGTGVEAVNVPSVVQAHHKLFAGGICLCQQGVHALDVLLAEDALVIVQEVAVVGGHGVSVELVVHGGGVDGTGKVAALDVVGVQQDFLQGTGCHQFVELVIGKGENVGSGLRVSQNGVLGAGLGLNADIDGDVALVSILCDEGIRHFTQHGLIFFGTPHGQLDIAPAFSSGGSLTGGGGCALRCSRGSGAAAAGGQNTGSGDGTDCGEDITAGNPIFHDCVLLLIRF